MADATPLTDDQLAEIRTHVTAEADRVLAALAQHRDQVLTEAAELLRAHRGDLSDDSPWWDTRDRDTAANLLLAARATKEG